MRNVIFGTLAGITATLAMTAAMRRLDRLLPAEQRYPLPPRELTQRTAPGLDNTRLAEATVAAHFGYGAAAGVLYAFLPRKLQAGPAYGVLVWGLSYLGWIPAMRILAPATSHPAERNLLMLAAHLVWGAALAASLREIRLSAAGIFDGGPTLDAPDHDRGGRA